jgi:hypothetical protein
MFKEYISQKSGNPYLDLSLKRWISNQKSIDKYRDKPKN